MICNIRRWGWGWGWLGWGGELTARIARCLITKDSNKHQKNTSVRICIYVHILIWFRYRWFWLSWKPDQLELSSWHIYMGPQGAVPECGRQIGVSKWSDGQIGPLVPSSMLDLLELFPGYWYPHSADAEHLSSRSRDLMVILPGILQNMVNPSLDPTQPDGSELSTFSYRGECIPRVLKQYRFSPHR